VEGCEALECGDGGVHGVRIFGEVGGFG
jgi:hypothetical protein